MSRFRTEGEFCFTCRFSAFPLSFPAASLVGMMSIRECTHASRRSGLSSGQRRNIEDLWRVFFSNPSKWWDHRSEKVNARYPDFKHKMTQDALWLNSKFKPPWVESELAAMPPGAVQSSIFPWNSRLARYSKAERYEETLDLFRHMQREGMNPNRSTFISVLNACASLRALEEGRNIHTEILQCGCESDVYVGNSLLDMYAKCGSIEDAYRVFNTMPTRNVVAWNAMILGYVKCGQGRKALELFQQMQEQQVKPVRATFLGLVNACASLRALEEGRQIHSQIKKSVVVNSDVCVCNSLVDMYAKCGSIEEAFGVFNEMAKRDVVSWNSIISGHVKCGQAREALALSQQMQTEGIQPDSLTFVSILNACANIGALKEGELVHMQIIQCSCDSDVFVGSSLVNMYAKCGKIEDAWRVFCKMPTRNVVCWNAMILGYVKCGQAQKGLNLSRQMQREGVTLNRVTFLALLNACANLAALDEGKHVHQQITQNGIWGDIFVENCVMDMYAKCGSIEDAWKVFQKMSAPDVVSWNAMIWGYVKCREPQRALELYGKMLHREVEPDALTFVGVINACANLGTLGEGRHVHAQAIRYGWESDVCVGNSLVDMYGKCGCVEDAWRVFNKMSMRDVVSWNAMILGCVKCGQEQRAFNLWRQMEQEGVTADPFTFVGLLNACATSRRLEDGRRVHGQVIRSGYESDVFVGNSLVDMYAKCGSIDDAWRVFNMLPTRDVVSWSAMIQGYVKCGQGEKALALSQHMKREGVVPDTVTFVGLLNACACLAALEEGRSLHKQSIRCGCESDVFVRNSLIDMYAKCGSLDDAWGVFDKIPKRDLVAWSAMIKAYVKCGQGHKALELYKEMQQEQVKADIVTFVALLNACADVGACDEGRWLHKQIIERGFESDIFIGNSLIDMYAKCGSIDDAWRVFKAMPTPCVVSWTALLGGYAMHGHAKEALGLFQQMCLEEVVMDNVTFVSILSACSHGGLVDEGLQCFESMARDHCVTARLEHYVCIAHLLGRAGRLHEAAELIETMSCESDLSVWICLLSACRVHGDVEMGERVATRVLELDPGNSAASVLLANIYAAAAKEDGRACTLGERSGKVVQEPPGLTWIEVNNQMHSFTLDDQLHPQIEETRVELGRLCEQIKEVGYVPDSGSVLHTVEGEEKLLVHHSEKLAIAYGLINTCPGTPIRIFKNSRVCRDCHQIHFKDGW